MYYHSDTKKRKVNKMHIVDMFMYKYSPTSNDEL